MVKVAGATSVTKLGSYSAHSSIWRRFVHLASTALHCCAVLCSPQETGMEQRRREAPFGRWVLQLTAEEILIRVGCKFNVFLFLRVPDSSKTSVPQTAELLFIIHHLVQVQFVQRGLFSSVNSYKAKGYQLFTIKPDWTFSITTWRMMGP